MEHRSGSAALAVWEAEPNKLVSLWGIVVAGIYTDDEFITGPFNNLFFMLGRLDDDPMNTPAQRYQVALMAEQAAKYMEQWGLRVSASHTQDLHRIIKIWTSTGEYPIGGASIHDLVTLIRQALHIELERTVFLNVREADALYYREPLHEVTEETVSNFASALEDMREASRCFALRRYSASVFHSMRVAEIGLIALGNDLSVPAARNKNWEVLINEIEKAIKAIDAQSRGANWRDDRQWYADAAVQFRYFKDAYRNEVMHVHQEYGPQHSRAILDSVRAFMNQIATRLHD